MTENIHPSGYGISFNKYIEIAFVAEVVPKNCLSCDQFLSVQENFRKH